VLPAPSELDRLAALLNASRRVTLLCGSGCAGAHEELLMLGEKLKSPMVHALRGKEHVEWGNPYDVGMTGLIGLSSGYYAMKDCDTRDRRTARRSLAASHWPSSPSSIGALRPRFWGRISICAMCTPPSG
jgi:hypothetical protein